MINNLNAAKNFTDDAASVTIVKSSAWMKTMQSNPAKTAINFRVCSTFFRFVRTQNIQYKIRDAKILKKYEKCKSRKQNLRKKCIFSKISQNVPLQHKQNDGNWQ